MKYRVAVTRQSVSRKNRSAGDSERPAYNKIVTASRPGEAVEKCAAEIWALCDDDIKVVSCYVGKPGSASEAANRMHPIQISR